MTTRSADGKKTYGLLKKNAALIMIVLSCTPPQPRTGVPPTFTYASIAGRKIAFARPVVLSSEIFYENRFTDQSYHSMDRTRTQDAFFRDFKQKVGKAKLPWLSLGESTDSLMQRQITSVNKAVDSLPPAVIERLKSDSLDVVVLVYAVRLYHQQSIGLRPDKTGSVNSYTSIISKSLDYICSIMDVRTNRPVFCIPIKKVQNDNSLDFMERAIDDLFNAIPR
jgi:hypothetical protein